MKQFSTLLQTNLDIKITLTSFPLTIHAFPHSDINRNLRQPTNGGIIQHENDDRWVYRSHVCVYKKCH